ncbi:DUF2971 domain-containing protein [Colwellia sp. MB3u-28]|jgi:hypothetical protein|uniref:DUF2971 domain-containing protein n=2 Tax=unclassified Colwellia TaxID=196834 RepID=UPI0015F3A5BD|nr:DUF2971 domain-containing protein [Colwellia sp. MB3u-28]MBA6234389.1 DUF2971 domain-containing protein [Colwellia sp. MB02u-7]MBA6237557.1 DUF2971 domain-containing protein [Colwellia sp. MB02u-11]MBA6260132.1 DUF2971 domain-containing protein [Colwellia sp. MB3u-41]MBA6300189.1 DUF2971 domain-containing protein [Colwellia sp. MB3u-22]MBA6312181.1 DUF2971 domain-containing protein [Colwellia sp. MB3u-64]
MSLEQPVKIYRYRDFSEYTVDSLCMDQLFFANPNSFNDPMDCQPTIESDSDNIELRAILSELIKNRVETETLSTLKSAKINLQNSNTYARDLARTNVNDELARISYYATNPEYEEQGTSTEEAENWILLGEIRREIINKYNKGVCCFSSSYESSLLWSHYGDQHQGLCVGYSLSRNPAPILHKVIYDDNRVLKTSLIAQAMLQNDLNAKKQLDDRVLLRKATPWKYEDEWRIFDSVGLNDSPLAMTDITFGLRCPSSIMHTIINALKDRDDGIDFYQMRQISGSYELRRVSIDGEISSYFPRTARSGIEIFGPVDK